ncbi:hypothetical protein MKZ38_002308 [Zalerion maritima]|uniref:Uncharacterized protein n=1 Tax=Zalerion maritima TaxID=339359 RepID=A0AAD5RQ15_9PEZI|nr:hypothetical protein MKZ38_002308 [Zalerion maritima]
MSSKGNHGGLARHFTRRNKNASSDLGRNASISIRSKISGPVELIHTTNMLSYNAPDINDHRSASSTTASSGKSDSDSDSTAPTVASSNASSPPTSPDVANSPEDRKSSPQPNHLSCYFTPPVESTTGAPAKQSPAPSIPSRAPSHTKKNSELSRQRSIARFSSQSNHSSTSKASFSFSRASSTSTSTSHSSMMSNHGSHKPYGAAYTTPPPMPPLQHALPRHPPHPRHEPVENPFGQELAKVTELAEEFGVQDKFQIEADDDERYMKEKHLRKYRAEDYLSEIQGLLSDLLGEVRPAQAPMWI